MIVEAGYNVTLNISFYKRHMQPVLIKWIHVLDSYYQGESFQVTKHSKYRDIPRDTFVKSRLISEKYLKYLVKENGIITITVFAQMTQRRR